MAQAHSSSIDRYSPVIRRPGWPLRPSESVLAAYFLYAAASSAWTVALPGVSARRLLATLAATVVVLLLAWVDLSARSRFLSILRDWLPLAGILPAYWAVDWHATAAHTHELERGWIVWDRVLLNDWGGRAAIESLGPVLPMVLEFSYSLLYAIPPVAVGVLYLCGRRSDVDRFLFTLLVPTLTAYALLARFPSEGPEFVFPGQDLPHYHSLFRSLNLWLLGAYDIRASVFPSGHVTIAWSSALALYVALPERPWVSLVLAAMAASISIATVYGRYHYAVDGLAGMAISAVAGGASAILYPYAAGGASRKERE